MNNLDALLPSVKKMALEFLKKLDLAGIKYSVIETRRSQDVQDAYFSQGRDDPEVVNEKRKKAGLYALSENECKKVITKAKVSKHTSGLALDVAPVVNGKILWTIDATEKANYWKRLGEIGESCGFVWGGRWTPLDKYGLGWDLPHFEGKE